MKIKVDQSKCIGCGACVSIASKSFKLKEVGDRYKSQPIEPVGDDIKTIKGAVNCCPVKAISLEDL